MAYVEPGPLVCDIRTAKEIIREIHRLFLIHTDNITMTASPFALQILVIPRPGEEIELPDGELVFSLKKDKFEILGTPDLV